MDPSRLKRKWVASLSRWFDPVNLRRLVHAKGALDSISAFAFTVMFFCELARPGTFTSRDALKHMTKHDLRRYLAFYLWYAIMYLAQLTVSVLMYLDVRNVKFNVEGRRRTILAFLVFSPTLLVNLILSASNVLYFPWAPLGLFYVMHTLYVVSSWPYAFRYYHRLADDELVHFETPLTPSRPTARIVTNEDQSEEGPSGLPIEGETDGIGWSEPPAVMVAQLVTIDDEYTLATFKRPQSGLSSS